MNIFLRTFFKVFDKKPFPLFKRATGSYVLRSSYEIPEDIRKTFHLANASILDNTNYYYHLGIQASHKKLLEDVGCINPNNSDYENKNILNSVIKSIQPCRNCLEVTFPIEKDNGTLEIIQGYRVQHSYFRLPCLGGLRFDPTCTQELLKGFASLTTFKHACLNLPFGGSHGAIKIDPKQYSRKELRRIIHKYIIECSKKGFIDPAIDIFDPDVGCGSWEMAMVVETYQNLFGYKNFNSLACAVGKPESKGGLHDYKQACGNAVFYGVENIINEVDLNCCVDVKAGWKDKNIIIHGLGKFGAHAAKHFVDAGAVCVGVIEDNCAFYKYDGININELLEYKKKHGSIENYKAVKLYEGDLLVLPCDMLILASTHKVINYNNAQKIQAKIVVEIANAAITPAANLILHGKNILVIPDIYISTGYSIAGYLEYLKNTSHITWGQIAKSYEKDNIVLAEKVKARIGEYLEPAPPPPPTEISINKTSQNLIKDYSTEADIVNAFTYRIMESVSSEIMNTALEFDLGIDLRTSCYINAIRRLFKTQYEMHKYE